MNDNHNDTTQTTQNLTNSQTQPTSPQDHVQSKMDEDEIAEIQKLSFLAQAFKEVMGE